MSAKNTAILCMLVVGLLAACLGEYLSQLRKSLPDETIVEVRRVEPVRIPVPAKEAIEPYRIPDAPPRSLAAESDGATVRLRFTSWFNQVKMDRRKRERVSAILEKHAETVRNFSINWSGDGRKRARQASIDELAHALEPVLEPAELGSFKSELAFEEVRRAISNLGADLYRQGAPLTEEQVTQLKMTFSEFRPESEKNGPVIELSAVSWDAALQKAASFLSQQQLDAVCALAARDKFNQKFRAIGGSPTSKLVPSL